MRVLIDGYFEVNFGDDLFFKTLIERYPSTTWILNTSNKKYKNIFSKEIRKITLGVSLYKKILLRTKIKKSVIEFSNYRDCDMLVIIGGSIFMDKPELKKIYEDREKLIRYFHDNGKKVFILGANFGPVRDESFIEYHKGVYKLCTDICFRDQYSYNLFNSMSNVRLAPDIIFQLKSEEFKKNKKTVGFSLIDLENRKDLKQYSDEYENKIRELIMLYLDNDYSVSLFSFCDIEGDMKAIHKIIQKLEESYIKRIKILNYTGDIVNFTKEFQCVENIIGTRFHSVILSQVFKQGLFPLIYSDKTYNVLKDINLDKHYKYIKDIENLKVKDVYNITKTNKLYESNVFMKSEEHFMVLDKYLETMNEKSYEN
ncbi:polysaccharide pyruvyl transferase family protein [Gottfriedia acidiceleris]|uniref:polysaccharide pyruvyl transferase family protein n=1 Tax=Gottfriedia acidiceleris TaxID=371036 RepID=UPI002FFE9C1A